MCLYPKLIQNPKYKKNKKNGGNIPPVNDTRVLHVPIGCGECIECRKQKQRGWQIRLMEDIKENKNGKFIALTFSNENYTKLFNEIKITCPEIEGYAMDNAIATLGVKRWLGRWRKKFKKSIRHWLVTELGHNGTENIHLHGIVWTNETFAEIRDTWQYGYIYPRYSYQAKQNYVNEASINYITKYVTKKDVLHKTYKAIILTSPGIGANYTKKQGGDWERNKYKGTETNEAYRTRSGHKMSIPIYWRNKIYTDEERELLWIQRLDKEERWIRGERVDISKSMDNYWKTLKWHREENIKLGYGTANKDWKRAEYEKQIRLLKQEARKG